MLVLSRKEGQQLLIGDNIVLTINRISGNRVAIGIDAPREVRIVRGELDRRELPDANEFSPGGDSCVVANLDHMNISVASKPHA